MPDESPLIQYKIVYVLQESLINFLDELELHIKKVWKIVDMTKYGTYAK